MPSSSGPRWTIWSHMWRTIASVMLFSRVALTTPAIPHIRLVLSFHAGRGRIQPIGCQRHIRNTQETIVAVLARVAFPPLASSQENICHLPRGDKMQSFFALRCASDKFFQEFPEGVADEGIFLGWIHTMAMQFDEKPIRTPLHVNPSLLPQRQPVQSRRIWPRNRACLQDQSH